MTSVDPEGFGVPKAEFSNVSHSDEKKKFSTFRVWISRPPKKLGSGPSQSLKEIKK